MRKFRLLVGIYFKEEKLFAERGFLADESFFDKDETSIDTMIEHGFIEEIPQIPKPEQKKYRLTDNVGHWKLEQLLELRGGHLLFSELGSYNGFLAPNIPQMIADGIIEEVVEAPEPELRAWTDEDVKRVIVLSRRYCKEDEQYDELIKNYKKKKE